MSESTTVSGEALAWWARFTLLGGLLALALLLLGPLGFRLGVLGVQGAVLLAPGMAVALAVVTLGFALVGLVLTIRRGLTRERMPVLIGGVLALAILINMGAQFARAGAVPPIHDITTAPEDPPQFDAVVAARVDALNSLDYDAATIAPQTRESYPFVQPLLTDMTPAEAFARAEALVTELGWELVAANAATGLIEATDTTALYGFKDDVAIRVRADAAGARIDLRSVSRVGVSDLGANAARIGAFLERF